MIGAPNGFFRVALAAAAIALSALAISIQSAAAQAPPGFALHESARPVPDIQFENGRGEAMSLADLRGKIVLLNLWATWCGPCRREMPTLDRLQAELGGSEFEVVALSLDRQGLPTVKAFYEELGLKALPIYVDRSGKAQRTLNVLGIPTTLLLNREGHEVGRLLGPAEWDSPEMVSFIRGYVERQSGTEPSRALDASPFASHQDRHAAAGRMLGPCATLAGQLLKDPAGPPHKETLT